MRIGSIRFSKTDRQSDLMLVVYTISKYFSRVQDQDVLLTPGYIGLHNAMRRYNKAKSRFSTYAVKCITGEILRAMKDMLPGPVDAPENIDLVIDEYSYRRNGYDRELKSIDIRMLIDKANLDRKELKIVNMFLYGCSVPEISRRMKMTNEGVRYKISKLILKLQKKAGVKDATRENAYAAIPALFENQRCTVPGNKLERLPLGFGKGKGRFERSEEGKRKQKQVF